MASLTQMRAFRASPVSAPARSRRSVQVRAAKAAAKGAKSAYVCIDCGWVYTGKEAFESLPNSYRCPVCQAPKRRFRAQVPAAKLSAKQRQVQEEANVDENDKQLLTYFAAGSVVLLGALYAFLNYSTQ